MFIRVISTFKKPPGMLTKTLFLTSCILFVAITLAQAPVPHASVTPTPLSFVKIEFHFF